ncbi:hypothetical protein POTOM_028379 [Populus tomentosa]|uniref:Uncharacterized protein n=1 Tax=Populus tomentosa TaxID=118781 RepID=A0A8X7ZEC5_POPTO|nr:hypothetical protein POTOM_028379 [Populus tomentosa]
MVVSRIFGHDSYKILKIIHVKKIAICNGNGCQDHGWKLRRWTYEEADDVVAEKLAQELLWITNKLRDYGVVDEALLQWSYASGLASLALSTVNPRVQGYIAKISGICFHS